MGKGGLCGIASTASYPVKEHDNPRVPLMCDPFGWSECAAGSTCSCNWPFFFNLFCIRWVWVHCLAGTRRAICYCYVGGCSKLADCCFGVQDVPVRSS